jgi:glycerate dehydrogenase
MATKIKNPRIAFLDESTLNFGDLDDSKLKKFPHYQSFATTTPEELLAHASEAHVLLTNKVVLNADTLQKLPALKLISVTATGVNNVDVGAAKALGITVCNVPHYSTTSVAEQTLLFLLSLSRRHVEHHMSAIHGEWSHSPIFCVSRYPFHDLHGKTLGILGYGAIGKRVASLAKAFGMKILIGKIPGRKYAAFPKRVSLEGLFEKSDFVTLHCPLTPETEHLIDLPVLQKMKPTASLINLARGPIVDENDIVRALQMGVFHSYATDVLSVEPPPANHLFFCETLKNKILFSPHVAWASRESRQNLLNIASENISNFFKGKPKNRV